MLGAPSKHGICHPFLEMRFFHCMLQATMKFHFHDTKVIKISLVEPGIWKAKMELYNAQ